MPDRPPAPTTETASECICEPSYVRDQIRLHGKDNVDHSVACDLRWDSARNRELRIKVQAALARAEAGT